MRPLVIWLVAGCLLVGSPWAQDRAALAARDVALRQQVVAEMHELADALAAEQQHARALALRQRIWMDYLPDDQRAREACGFVKFGTTWRKSLDALVLDRDLKGKASRIRRLDRDEKKRVLAWLKAHRELAQAWTAAGDEEAAGWHWQCVLALEPGAADAAAALRVRAFEGFFGDEHELQMLRRGRGIHLACDWLNATSFELAELSEPLGLLAAVGVEHSGVASEHFRVHGTLPIGELRAIAADCERALLLCHTVFGVSSGARFRSVRRRNLVFLSPTGYQAALDHCRSQFDEQRYRFLRDEVDLCYLDHGGESLRVHKAELGVDVARDQAVRGVVQDALGIVSEGLWEGVGHMACGMLFGRTLTFLREQLHERTQASFTQQALAPDLEVWMQIAQESAWAKSDTRTSELVLLRAAKFTNEQRVKAWAICHYFAHVQPEWMLELEASRGKGNTTPPEVERRFRERTGRDLVALDQDWRSFWARGDELRAAMRRDPLAALPKGQHKHADASRQLLAAVNAARAEARVGPSGYLLDGTPDFAAVVDYQQALARAEREQQQREAKARKGRKVEPVVMPTPPAVIGRTVLWAPDGTADEAVAAWLRQPPARDALLHPGRLLFAVPSRSLAGGHLLGVDQPAQPTRFGEPGAWPRHRQKNVSGALAVGALDGLAQQALLQAGIAADAQVGMPLTLHFARAVGPAALAAVACRVFVDGEPIEAVILRYERASASDAAPSSVPGLIACIPTSPLPSGAEIEVQWQVPAALLRREVAAGRDAGGLAFAPIAFTTR